MAGKLSRGKDLGQPAELEPVCVQVPNSSLACGRNIVSSKAGMFPLYSALLKLHLKTCIQFLVPHHKEGIEVLEQVQRRATELVKGLEHRSYEDLVSSPRSFAQVFSLASTEEISPSPSPQEEVVDCDEVSIQSPHLQAEQTK
ncbi:hypothetical protein HGM15179_017289 [Zosterops borbonicus]|uniref:Uncharacterized protein n=1 Tax=Zosterops borbonicus TaxID=364589 RepID=A0A8K1G173_9PASS|nr:hypothetical protein HGM15179_017289 [Zosterops borbonicus]